MFNFLKNNPADLKKELETIYQSFESETRNFNQFVYLRLHGKVKNHRWLHSSEALWSRYAGSKL